MRGWFDHGIQAENETVKLRALSFFFLSALVMGRLISVQTPAILAADKTATANFSRDVLPILADNCFTCHGPDAGKRRANLRLDTREGIFADRGGYQAVVPGKAAVSRLYQKISASDETMRMPPDFSDRKLTPAQIETIKRWIDEGAAWDEHWAYVAPKRPPAPEVKDRSWTRNPIDHFILARLEREALQPSPEADRATLLRRVSFDLTGLPPTPEEVSAFIADKSPDAYEKQVDRLLASPHYGENMARMWLDLARYADSAGGLGDELRGMWLWRDWVIQAYNQNLPYDQFTIKQLAGDLLTGATIDDKIASGFNRNHSTNLSESGEQDPVADEDRVAYVADRVNTTGTTWLGLTVGCARCHDHKYDPIKQKDFYRLAAYFNNVPEFANANYNGNTEPVLTVPSPRQQKQIEVLQAGIAAALAEIPEKEMAKQENQWRDTALATIPSASNDGLSAYYEFEDSLSDRSGHGHDASLQRGKMTYPHGAVGKAAAFNGETEVDFGNVADFDRGAPFALSLWANPKTAKQQNLLQKRDASPNWTGLEISLDDPNRRERSLRIAVRLASRWPEDAIEIRSREQALTSIYVSIKDMGTPGHHIVLNYDGSGKAAGLKLYLDGKPVDMEIVRDRLTGSFRTAASMSIGNDKLGLPFGGEIDELRVYGRELTDHEIDNLYMQVPARGLLTALQGKPVEEIPALRQPEPREDENLKDDKLSAKAIEAMWQKQQQRRLSDYFMRRAASPQSRKAYAVLMKLRDEKTKLEKSIPTTMVMAEMDKPMDTFVLGRGQHYNKQEKVTPGVPAFLLPLPKDAPANRLALARWLMDPGNPLTARVEVNRYWQHFFGTGIVKTAEDFGTLGERPTHPELLDWLATEFIRTGWDIKAMQRLIVVSATYRQSSRTTPQLQEKDPENRLLARGPRLRLTAEEIRDNALTISGLLTDKVGGPSVYPYQPAGLWNERSANGLFFYKQAKDADLYRRSLYTIWRRTLLAPSLSALDAPNREVCVARRIRTNTPLQALVLLDDPTFVEASRLLAQRAILKNGNDPGKRLDFLFLWAIERKPNSRERDLLLREEQSMLAEFRRDREAARKLLNVGETKPNPGVDPAELAAWTTVTRTILNMDETITKQ
jgi:Protein of unknown function (DUF1553)/Protein of unknown function (DUF1549)/Planctomycete cytochrome C/Concanavalin A-like lectin/glucanases superfamily